MNVAAAIALGLFAGSLLLEGLVLVPFWRTLGPDQFFALHRSFGPRLFRYFAPITMAAAIASVVSAVVHRRDPHPVLSFAAAALTIITLASFPLFFAKANKAFELRSISNSELPLALTRWAQVHAIRTAVSLIAFLLSVVAVT